MKKISLLPLALFFSSSLFAQEEVAHSADVAPQLMKLSFVSPAFGYEFRVAPKFTIQPEISMDYANLTVKYNDQYGEQKKDNVYIGANIQAQGRFYYNLDKRLRKGKSIDNNSGNYLALSVGHFIPFAHTNDNFTIQNYEIPFPENKYLNNINFGIYWGLQRVYKNHLFIDLRLGIQSAYFYKFNNSHTYESNSFSAFNPHVEFRFGYAFTHKNNAH